jgi:hypothetical protein
MAAYNGLKFAKDSLSTLIQGKVEIEAQARISEALTKLGDAQDALFQLRDELFTMQAETARLKAEIDRTNNWKDRLSSYELVKTAGGAVVYRFKGNPEHFACPSCVNGQKLEILQDNRTMSGKFRCSGCTNEYPINPREEPAPVRAQGEWSP